MGVQVQRNQLATGDTATNTNKEQEQTGRNRWTDALALGVLTLCGWGAANLDETKRIANEARATANGLLGGSLGGEYVSPLEIMERGTPLQDVRFDQLLKEIILIGEDGKQQRLSATEVEVNTNSAPEGHHLHGRPVVAVTGPFDRETTVFLPNDYEKRDPDGNPIVIPPIIPTESE